MLRGYCTLNIENTLLKKEVAIENKRNNYDKKKSTYL